MSAELSHHELEDLLGAYALDAVTDEERAQVEAFLERSRRARDEVARFRETAALLAHAGSDAPPGLWDRIEQSLDAGPPAPVLPLARPRRARTRARVAAAAAVAASVVAITLLGVEVIRQEDRIDDLESVATEQRVLAAAEQADRDPDAEHVSLASIDGSLRAEVVYLPDGSGYVIDDNLARLPEGRIYQLWALVGDEQAPRAISAGVLGRDPGVSAFRIEAPIAGFMVTEEEAPGVAVSDRPALLQGRAPR